MDSKTGNSVENLPIKFDGDRVVFGLNPKFLIQGLESLQGDEFTLEMTDGITPVTLRQDENSFYVALTMRVSDDEVKSEVNE